MSSCTGYHSDSEGDTDEIIEDDSHEEFREFLVRNKGGIHDPSGILLPGITTEDCLAELEREFGMKIRIYEDPSPVPPPITHIEETPNVNKRLADSAESAKQVGLVGFDKTYKKNSWNKKTRARTQVAFDNAVELQQDLMKEIQDLRKAYSALAEERNNLYTRVIKFKRDNQDLRTTVSSKDKWIANLDKEIDQLQQKLNKA